MRAWQVCLTGVFPDTLIETKIKTAKPGHMRQYANQLTSLFNSGS